MKRPSIQFYPGDWLRDAVSGCSLAAQALWFRMMFLMHDSERYGYLVMNGKPMPAEFIARRCGSTFAEYEPLLAELDLAGVPSRTPEGIIYSRRMVRDEKERKDAAKRQRRHREKSEDLSRSYNGRVTGESRPSSSSFSSSSSPSPSKHKNHSPPTPPNDAARQDQSNTELLDRLVEFSGSPQSLPFYRQMIQRLGHGLVEEALGEVRMRDQAGSVKDKAKYLTALLDQWAEGRKKR